MGVWCVRIGDDCGCKMEALLTVLVQGTCTGDNLEMYNCKVVGNWYEKEVVKHSRVLGRHE